MVPARAVIADVCGWHAAVSEHDPGVLTVRGQNHLDGRTAGREAVIAENSPAEDDSARWVDGEVGTAGDDLAHVEREHPAGPRVEFGPQSPIQVTMSAGSVKYGNTTSGGALMCSIATMTSPWISALTAASSAVGGGQFRPPS